MIKRSEHGVMHCQRALHINCWRHSMRFSCFQLSYCYYWHSALYMS